MPDVRFDHLPTRLGELLLVDRGEGLSGLYFPDHRRGPTIGPDWRRAPGHFVAVAEAITGYLGGDPAPFDLVLAPRGTSFQQEVWVALRDVGYGATVSYGELATRLGRPGSARAVAAAVARNPLSIVVPCHRVVGSDGRLAGYAGGLARKRDLLAMEQRVIEGRGSAA